MNKDYTQLVEEIVATLLTEINWDKAHEYLNYWGPDRVEDKASLLGGKGSMTADKNPKKAKALHQASNALRNTADVALVQKMERDSEAGERVSREVMPLLQRRRAFVDASGPLPRPRPI